MNQEMIQLDGVAMPASEMPLSSQEYKPVGGPAEMPEVNMNHEAPGTLTGTQAASGEMPPVNLNGAASPESTEYKPVGGTGEMPQIGTTQNSSSNFLESIASKNIDLSGSWNLKIIVD